MSESARPATRADATKLNALLKAFVDEIRADRGGHLWAAREAVSLAADSAIDRALADVNQLVLAGCLDRSVVGFAIAALESLDDGTCLAVLRALYVEPAAREVGVGAALIAAVIEWATVAGCRGVDSLVLPGNRVSKNFFEAHGLVARAIVVHRSLTDGAP
jgi:GNAT superfamily N-acetyltransferase